MVLAPIEMKKMNCRGHIFVVSKNQESKVIANDNPNYHVLFKMENDVGTKVTRSIYNKKNTTITLEWWCHPQIFSKAAWNCSQQFHLMIANQLHKNGAQIFTPMEPSRKSPTKWHHKKGSLRQHNASYRYNHGSKPTLKLPLGASWVRPKLGVQCSQIVLFYPLAYWNLSMKQSSFVVLFCLYLWDPSNWDASACILGFFLQLSRTGALAWFYGVWTCGVKVLEYWMIFSLKIKLDRS